MYERTLSVSDKARWSRRNLKSLRRLEREVKNSKSSRIILGFDGVDWRKPLIKAEIAEKIGVTRQAVNSTNRHLYQR